MEKRKAALISPIHFVDRMEKHWAQNLANVSSEPLKQVWHQLARVFGQHILSHEEPEQAKQWTILQPPTGSGKTQGTIVYCWMLSEQPPEWHPGVLIVTRLIAEADGIADKINEMSGRQVAVAYHSESKKGISIDELEQWPVLVITHRAYELALDHLGAEGTIQKTWPYFHAFSNGTFDSLGGTRKLVIIDECLDIVEHSQAGLDGLRNTLGAIPHYVVNKFPREIEAIKTVIGILELMQQETKGESVPETLLLKGVEHIKELTGQNPPDLTGLRRELRDKARFDRLILKMEDPKQNLRLKKIHDDRLKSLHYIFRSWSYYAKLDSKPSMNTARLLVPEDVKGAVVLDATASSNVLYEIFDNALVVQPPAGSRCYQNVTLHISRNHKLGKVYMRNNHKELCADLVSDLQPRLKDRRTFIVCHKDVEPILASFGGSLLMKTGHWGKVDGSNEWKDCDAAVIFGLPYRPDTWSANVFMACQGPQETQWLRNSERPFNGHADIRAELKTGQMIVDIVQAINRVQCRKVIDRQGNCPATGVYMLLPKGHLADQILQGIRHEMPGINIVEDWDYLGQKHKRKRPRRSNHETALIKYLENMESGTVPKGRVIKLLGMSPKTFYRLMEKHDDPESLISKTMKKAGVTYETERAGKSFKAYFVKE